MARTKGRQFYEVDGKKYYFNNPVFTQKAKDKYKLYDEPYTLSNILAKAINNEYEKVQKVERPEAVTKAGRTVNGKNAGLNFKTIESGYIAKKNGRYSSPNNIDVVKAMARVLGCDYMELLTEDYSIEVAEIANIDMDECSTAEEILVRIVLAYSDSDAYYLMSGFEGDDAYTEWIKYIDRARALIKGATEIGEITVRRLELCDEIESFVSKCEYADGLSKKMMSYNPNLKFFTAAYHMANENLKTYALCRLRFSHYPEYIEDIIAMRDFFNSKNGLGEEEELFMRELAETVRQIYNMK